ncbi:MAG: sugar ABC transporter permease [Ktedonobacteraceae bacterium]|nr:sugar ABC transporter permease [Ktedonobacteraceae bacterium]
MQLISRSPATTEDALEQVPLEPRRSSGRRVGTIVLFLLPSAVLYVVFILLPVVQAAFYSLFRWSGLGPLSDFSGLRNYVLALTDKVFIGALVDNLIIVILSLLIQLPISLCLALIIGKSLPGRTIFRTIFFLPFILSDVVAGVIWSFIYRPEGGLLNTTLHQLFPGFQAQLWLGNPKIVLGSIFVVMIWKYFGLHLVLYMAAIQDIPDEIVEAARIDGASALQVVRYISVPLLGSTIRLTIFLSALGSLQYFDLIWIMSSGGPVHASETMATYLIKYGFQSFAMGFGSAVGVIMFVICFIFSLTYQRLIMRRDLAGSITGAQT